MDSSGPHPPCFHLPYPSISITINNGVPAKWFDEFETALNSGVTVTATEDIQMFQANTQPNNDNSSRGFETR